ncbi:MAG TPA: hypothetical protein DHV28_11270 [Ignavibacteriales bacterium]|nr:hypothetical protein [Ignavibacteriales bacterium]
MFKISFASIYPLYIKKAEKKGRTKAEVDGSSLSSGMYFYSLQSNNKILTNKMILMR